jgi:GntR family transcriptional regulator, transcriptional repressor for pyruvate dehydrogenase complex
MAGDKTVTSKLFTAQEKTTSVNVVINAVKELLIQKKLLPGQKMPNEMEIANGLGVSRGTVREALKILSAFGIIEIKVGNGTYVAKTPQKSALDPMLFGLLLVDADTKKLSEFRKLIETDIIRLIFQYRNVNKRDIDDLINNVDELEKLCSRKEDAQIDELTFENDMEFHKIMGRASKNEMAERVYNFILDTFSYSIKISHTHQKLGEMALKTHRKILNAILANDLESAKEAVSGSIDVWEELQ